MEGKDYITIIEAQKQTIDELSTELNVLKENYATLIDKYHVLLQSQMEYKESIDHFIIQGKEFLDNLKHASEELDIASSRAENIDNHHISKYPLSGRVTNALLRAGLSTVDEIFIRYPSRDAILKITRLGPQTLDDLIHILESYGFDMNRYKEIQEK